MTFWTSKKTVFICLFLIVFGIPAIVLAATWWSYNNETNLVATDEFLVGSNTRGGLVNVLWSDVLSEIAADGTFQTVLTNEAGLYSALSDVSQFYEPGDLLQTEAGDSPTALDTNGQINMDNDDDQVLFRVGGSTYKFDFTSDASNYVLKSNGSGLLTMQADSNNPVILDLSDDASNESTGIGEIATKNDTNSIFTEPTSDKLYIDVGQNWPTCDLATTATTANTGDSATSFFSSGTIEDARIASTIARDSEITATKLDDFTTPDDNIDLNSSTTAHGLLPKLDNNSAHFLDGTGAWSTPGGSGTVTTNGTVNADEIAVFYDSTTIKALTESEFKIAYNMEAGTDYQGVLSDEAGLYSALSDVSQFYEPGDLLRTENGNTPTAPSNDGEFVVDTDDEQFIIRVGGSNKKFDFTGDSSGYVLKSNGSGVFSLAADASGGGGTPNILDLADDASNESTDLVEIATSGDTNSIFTEPSADKLLIDVSQNWPTADAATTATTATTANAGDSATAFFSAGTIEHEYGGLEADVSAYAGLVKITGGSTSAVTSTAFAESILDDADEATFKATVNLEIGTDVQAYDADLSTYAGITPSANVQTMLGSADNAAILANIGAEPAGISFPVLEERTITDPVDADDYYWFKVDGATTVSSVDCIAQGSTPSITVDVQECDSSGASCSSILSSVITCNGGNDAGTVSDSTLADNAWIYVALGTPSGTVSAISVTLAGTK